VCLTNVKKNILKFIWYFLKFVLYLYDECLKCFSDVRYKPFLAYKAVSERAELHKEVKEQKSLQKIKPKLINRSLVIS